MSFNLKKQAQIPNINDQRGFDSYLQMLITQLNGTGSMPTENALAEIADMNSLSNYGINSFTELKDMVQQQMELLERQEDMQKNMVAPFQEPETPVTINPKSKEKNKMIKSFNLKKAQEAQVPWDDIGLNDSAELGEPQLERQQDTEPFKKYKTHNDLNMVLLNIADVPNALQIAWRDIQSENPKEPDSVKEALERYFQDFNIKGDEARLNDAEMIYNFIYGNEEATSIEAPYIHLESLVNESSKAIKKISHSIVNKNKKMSFNLTKIAQHKSLDNAILWGPEQSRIDPFLHQPVSDWHIVERNKGFGLVVDDIWNIDYETIWRENIMDKYSRPYKNKEGNWVGGYLNKRFEIDKNIPEMSNMQLKPGQLRRPVVPEHGNTESRLQAARAAGEIAGADDISIPFNWKEASKKKS